MSVLGNLYTVEQKLHETRDALDRAFVAVDDHNAEDSILALLDAASGLLEETRKVIALQQKS